MSIVALSLLVVCLMSVYLILCHKYDDGIIGRASLAVLSLTAGVGFFQLALGRVTFDPVSETFFVAVAFFEAWHICKMYNLSVGGIITTLLMRTER